MFPHRVRQQILECQALQTDWMHSFCLKSKQAAISKNASDVNAAQSLAACDIVQAPALSSAKLVTSQSSYMLSNAIKTEAEEESQMKCFSAQTESLRLSVQSQHPKLRSVNVTTK